MEAPSDQALELSLSGFIYASAAVIISVYLWLFPY